MGKKGENEKLLPATDDATLLAVLKKRFESNMPRHPALNWPAVLDRLESAPQTLSALKKMEETGGEPDVIAGDKNTGTVVFADCAAESPAGRRSLCYDQHALEARKENKPKHSATAMALALGIELLTEEEYLQLQRLGAFDTKTSSWLKTPDEVRDLGGAIYGDRRYNRTFIGHNGADSYYAARGFRGKLKI